MSSFNSTFIKCVRNNDKTKKVVKPANILNKSLAIFERMVTTVVTKKKKKKEWLLLVQMKRQKLVQKVKYTTNY